jgi:hypothetical protein
MATQIRKIYVKTGDWNKIYNDVKFRAFSLNLTEMYDFLQQTSTDQHGRIKPDLWNDKLFAALDADDINTYNQMQTQARTIVKQARTLGLRAAYNDLGRLHLRDLL